jgi:hypothetical protein
MMNKFVFRDAAGRVSWFTRDQVRDSWESEVTWDGHWEELLRLQNGLWIRRRVDGGGGPDELGRPVPDVEKYEQVTEDEALAWFPAHGLSWPESLRPIVEARRVGAPLGRFRRRCRGRATPTPTRP